MSNNNTSCCSLQLVFSLILLCSEMEAHFSRCGRYLAVCVACVIPHAETDPGLQTLVQQDSGLATSPTRHPVTAHQVMYELCVYSLEKETFGSVLVSLAIRAAHCLTSIQFSPNSEQRRGNLGSSCTTQLLRPTSLRIIDKAYSSSSVSFRVIPPFVLSYLLCDLTT